VAVSKSDEILFQYGLSFIFAEETVDNIIDAMSPTDTIIRNRAFNNTLYIYFPLTTSKQLTYDDDSSDMMTEI
jgi:hypothetical protein